MVMNRWLDHWQTHSFGNWAISPLTNPEKIIGFGGLGIRNYDDIVINNLGYRLSTEAWGKGLATEFAIYAIKFGFDVIKLTEISAVVRENHLASQKVLQKSGLRYVKEIHDVKDASGYAAFPHAAFSNPELLTPCPGPALPGLPDHLFPVTDVKRETVPARMRPIEKSSLHQVRSRCWRQ